MWDGMPYDLTRGTARRWRWLFLGFAVIMLWTEGGLGTTLGAFAPAWVWVSAAVFVVSAGVLIRRAWVWRAWSKRPVVQAPVRRCAACGYVLDGIPTKEEPVEGVMAVRPTCPECGGRQF